MAADWLASILPFVSDAKQSAILRQHVSLLEAQRDDAINLLNKADAALIEAKEQIARLEGENNQLCEKLTHLKPATDLADDAAKILKHFFREDSPFSAEHMASIFQLQPSVAKDHFDTLLKRHFLKHEPYMIVNPNTPVRCGISAEGRAYVVEHGLA